MNATTVAVAAPKTIVIGSPSADLEDQVSNAVAAADSYVGAVTCQEMREALAEDLKANKLLQKTVETERTTITGPINEGLRATNAFFRRFSEPLERAEVAMKREALKWDQEQERVRQAKAAEAARKADEEKKRLEAQAAEQAKAGNKETAHAIQQAALFVAPVPVAAAPKIAGETHQERWHAEVDDIRALARAVADGTVPTAYIEAVMPALNAQARALKSEMAIPGVRAVCERVLATRAA